MCSIENIPQTKEVGEMLKAFAAGEGFNTPLIMIMKAIITPVKFCLITLAILFVGGIETKTLTIPGSP